MTSPRSDMRASVSMPDGPDHTWRALEKALSSSSARPAAAASASLAAALAAADCVSSAARASSSRPYEICISMQVSAVSGLVTRQFRCIGSFSPYSVQLQIAQRTGELPRAPFGSTV